MMWLATDNGPDRLDPRTGTRIDPVTWQFQTYGPADGADFRTRYIASRALLADPAANAGECQVEASRSEGMSWG